MLKCLLLLFPLVLLGGCSWGIQPTSASENVHTAWNDDVSACRKLGTITVSVLDHVGPFDRDDIKVRDELQVMARNQAVALHADTIKPLREPDAGKQLWGAYVCGRHHLVPAKTGRGQVPPRPPVQTFPLR